MNYLKIVLDGYFSDNNRDYLERYFFREYKKAEKDHFEADEFFNGCLNIIKSWKKNLQDQVNERKRDLYLMMTEAEKGTLHYENKEGKNIDQLRNETIEYCQRELILEGPDRIGDITFQVDLRLLTNSKINHFLTYNEVILLEDSILNTWKKIQDENYGELKKAFSTLINDKLSDLITHQKSIEIVEGIKIQYKNIKGKKLKLLLLALQDLELLPKERIAKRFHDCCRTDFNWDVATYNAMNGYRFNDRTDTEYLNSIKQHLESIINAH